MTSGTSQGTAQCKTEVWQGKVKWFNSQSGYGFIEVAGDDGQKSDLFVHHSGLVVGGDMFRYLVEGEYVEYSVKTIKRGREEKQTAYNVTGIGRGPLQCETRHLRRLHDSKRAVDGASRKGGTPSAAEDTLWSVVKDQLNDGQ